MNAIKWFHGRESTKRFHEGTKAFHEVNSPKEIHEGNPLEDSARGIHGEKSHEGQAHERIGKARKLLGEAIGSTSLTTSHNPHGVTKLRTCVWNMSRPTSHTYTKTIMTTFPMTTSSITSSIIKLAIICSNSSMYRSNKVGKSAHPC